MSPAPRPITDVLLRSQSDERLWALAGAGHPRAFTVLLQRHIGLLTVIARSVAGPGEAEDVIQEGAARAWRALQAGAEVTNPRAWLAAIVRHAATESASRAVPGSTDPESEVIDPRWVEGSVHDRVEVRDLLRAIGELPDNQRRVLVAAEFDGASRTEIAAALQVSEGAVRQLTHRARLTLRAAMTALIPFPLLSRVLAGGSASLSSSVSLEAVSSFAGGTAVLKGGAVLLAVGALGGGAALHAVLGGPSGQKTAAVHAGHGRSGHARGRVVTEASARGGAIPNAIDNAARLGRRPAGPFGRAGAGGGSGGSRPGRAAGLGAATTMPRRIGDGSTAERSNGAADGSGTDQSAGTTTTPSHAGPENGGVSGTDSSSQSTGQDAGGQSTSASDGAQTPVSEASSSGSQDGASTTTTPTATSGSDTTPTGTTTSATVSSTDTSTSPAPSSTDASGTASAPGDVTSSADSGSTGSADG